MMYKFTKKISCDDPTQCCEDIINKIETKFPVKIHAPTKNDFVNGHISINHINEEHQFWIFIYSSSGVHESAHGITEYVIETNNNRVKKFNGTFPSQKEIESIF